VAGFQWGQALARARVPFGLQIAENLDRWYPLPARMLRRVNLALAAFVVARSPTAAALARRYRPGLPAPVIPHHVPAWTALPRERGEAFVVGYAGRLVPEKGLDVLIDAVAGLSNVELRFVGNGPIRPQLERRAFDLGVALTIDSTVKHENMASAYAGFDVLVLPSRTTATWSEQFGRVLVEAMSCGLPVIGSDSGEIPWVIHSTGGGLVVPEDDAGALRDAIVKLRDSPVLRRELAGMGAARARDQFSVAAVARQLNVALRQAIVSAQPRRPVGDPPSWMS
jgi:glycosyltransferase involved in cell wall biosynthesis